MNLRVLLSQIYRTSKDRQNNQRKYEELTRLIGALISDFAYEKIYEPYLRNHFKCLIDRLYRIYN